MQQSWTKYGSNSHEITTDILRGKNENGTTFQVRVACLSDLWLHVKRYLNKPQVQKYDVVKSHNTLAVIIT